MIFSGKGEGLTHHLRPLFKPRKPICELTDWKSWLKPLEGNIHPLTPLSKDGGQNGTMS